MEELQYMEMVRRVSIYCSVQIILNLSLNVWTANETKKSMLHFVRRSWDLLFITATSLVAAATPVKY